jgi:bifunctional polynucleotide phosphatase/kinase
VPQYLSYNDELGLIAMSPELSKKRHIDSSELPPSTNKQKAIKGGFKNHINVYAKAQAVSVHPFFSRAAQDNSNAPFQWVKPSIGPKRTCLYGINLQPKCYTKVAAFDLDGTLIKSGSHGLKWEWLRGAVPSKLKDVHDAGCVHI